MTGCLLRLQHSVAFMDTRTPAPLALEFTGFF